MQNILTIIVAVSWVVVTTIAYLQTTELKAYSQEIVQLKEIIYDYEQFNNRTAKVKITFYAPSLKGINSDSNPTKTAIMDTPVPGWTCAISRDLVAQGWLGRKIYIQGLGVRYASDVMGKSYKGKPIINQIDICVGKTAVKSVAKTFGKNLNIGAFVL